MRPRCRRTVSKNSSSATAIEMKKDAVLDWQSVGSSSGHDPGRRADVDRKRPPRADAARPEVRRRSPDFWMTASLPSSAPTSSGFPFPPRSFRTPTSSTEAKLKVVARTTAGRVGPRRPTRVDLKIRRHGEPSSLDQRAIGIAVEGRFTRPRVRRRNRVLRHRRKEPRARHLVGRILTNPFARVGQGTDSAAVCD